VRSLPKPPTPPRRRVAAARDRGDTGPRAARHIHYATTVVDGLTIVTQSFQNSPISGREFNVTLE
jgi:hypothetical protein